MVVGQVRVTLKRKDGTVLSWDYPTAKRIPLLVRALQENEPDWDEITIKIRRQE